MANFVIQNYYDNLNHAGSKAVNDVADILKALGYNMIYIDRFSYATNTKYKRAIYKRIDKVLTCMRLKKLNSNDKVFIQWPLYVEPEYLSGIIKIITDKSLAYDLLFHDINVLRDKNKKASKNIVNFFCQANRVIVHSKAMGEYLSFMGVDIRKIRILNLFDYLIDDETPHRDYSMNVCFAGNLIKSEFLYKIDRNLADKIKFICYGLIGRKFDNGLIYKGIFNSSFVGSIEGAWGLVWDGNSTLTCSGEYGEYLRYNSPHKTSLYIVAGMPVIVWEQSALADYIRSHRLGVIIKSLDELYDKLSNISESEYRQMQKNVVEEAAKLKSGFMLKRCLE